MVIAGSPFSPSTTSTCRLSRSSRKTSVQTCFAVIIDPPPAERERSVARAPAPQAIEQHGDDDEAPDEGPLPERADSEQDEAVADDLDQRGADDRAEGRPGTAGQVGAADHRRSD